MGLVFTKLWSLLGADQEYKICIVGLDNAGKTTTLYKLALDEVVETHPTIGSNVEEVTHKNLKFQVWDLGGQDALRESWSTYYQDTNAVLVVIDSTDTERMGIVKAEILAIVQAESLSNACIVVFANKQDLRGAATLADISNMLGLHNIKSHPWHIQASCALTGEGLEQGMDWVVSKMTA